MTKLSYVLIAIVTILGFVIVMAPVGVVWSIIGEDVRTAVPGVEISSLQGSIWNGEGKAQFQTFPAAKVNWQLAAFPLVTGTLSYEIDASADDFNAEVTGSVSGNSGDISNANAVVGSEYINSVTLNYGLDLSGEFHLDIDHADFSDGWVNDIDGRLTWPGGVVHIETPQQVQTAYLPGLDGTLSMDGDRIHLNVVGQEENLIDVRLNKSGWAEVGITYGFMRLANLPLPSGSESEENDEIAILLEEKIL